MTKGLKLRLGRWKLRPPEPSDQKTSLTVTNRTAQTLANCPKMAKTPTARYGRLTTNCR
jgi:hypothetical protein